VGKLEGKIALITGGSSGIELATVKRFVDEGAHVFNIGRREAELASAVKDICKNVKALKGTSRSSTSSITFSRRSKETAARSISSSPMPVKYAALGEITEENGGSNE
jgi:NAD(P)-dependent dehydrogenase (short-subunit alcohol dehydrogenase family)